MAAAPNLPANCPPPDKPHCDGTYYRVVHNDPTRPEDFEAREPDDDDDPCLAAGLSLYCTLSAAEKLMRRARAYRESGVAEGVLQACHGHVARTGKQRAHYTWWVARGINPCDLFHLSVPVAGEI